MTEQEYAMEHWKFVAAYLASCHAATLEGWPKRGSKSERKRLVELCNAAAGFLRGTISPPDYGMNRNLQIYRAIERCEKAAKNHQITPGSDDINQPATNGGPVSSATTGLGHPLNPQ